MARLSVKGIRRLRFKQRFVENRERVIRVRLVRLYDELFNAIVENLSFLGVRKQQLGEGFPFNSEAFETVFFTRVQGLVSDAFNASLAQEGELIGVTFGRDVNRGIIQEYIKRQTPNIKGFARADADSLKRIVSESFGQGTQQDLIKILEKRFESLSTRRAAVVSRNLIFNAYSESRTDFWNEAAPGAAKSKVWLPSIGGQFDRVHHNRIPARGPVPFGGRFAVDSPTLGRVFLKFPNDMTVLAEALNCQCDYEVRFDMPNETDRQMILDNAEHRGLLQFAGAS